MKKNSVRSPEVPSTYLCDEGEILVSSRCDKLFSCKGNKIYLNESYQCDAQATCDKREAGRRCYCNKRYAGDGQTCTRIVDCYQLLRDGETTSGVYTVFPVNWPNKTLNVSCDMTTDGGGWTNFHVASEAGLYALGVSGYNTSSTAGNSLSLHDQMNFSTFDMDNDVSRNLNCAKMYSGGWWYNECSFANLNSNTQSQWMLNYYNDGINKTELKLRPKGV
ncbi:Tenascin-R [Holothuria leucospilota]|uniref:Tenascin-R n=1 Tax=Holothuria leucospilota TaxID=206669 RepID=A0A9Q1HDI7_HOLLE|nr:Tenascin-R [Holothuria leucospilota]